MAVVMSMLLFSIFYNLHDVNSCPDESFFNLNNTICYWVTDEKTTTALSSGICNENNGSLAVFKNEEEYLFLVNSYENEIINKAGNSWFLWIGGNDTLQEGTFTDIEGSPLQYFNWKWDQPDHYKFFQKEDCIAIGIDSKFRWKWHDSSCGYSYPALCYRLLVVKQSKVTTDSAQTVISSTDILSTNMNNVSAMRSKGLETSTVETKENLTEDIANQKISEDISQSIAASLEMSKNCLCRCETVLSTITLEKLVKSLRIDKTKTNAAQRKLSCAEDGRKSARSIGYMGIIVLCIVFGLFVLVDGVTLLVQ